MRIGVFSDVHGNLPALEAVLADGERLGIEAWICLGDLAVRGPFPQECLHRVRELPHTTTLVGNTDQWLFQGFPAGPMPPLEKRPLLDSFRTWARERLSDDDLAWLQALPGSHTLTLGGDTVLLVHAAPGDTERVIPATASEDQLAPLLEDPGTTIAIYGHIHIPLIRRVGGRTVANTGSVGLPFDGDPRASYLVLSQQAATVSLDWRRVPYDVKATIAAAEQRGFPHLADYRAGLSQGVPV